MYRCQGDFLLVELTVVSLALTFAYSVWPNTNCSLIELYMFYLYWFVDYKVRKLLNVWSQIKHNNNRKTVSQVSFDETHITQVLHIVCYRCVELAISVKDGSQQVHNIFLKNKVSISTRFKPKKTQSLMLKRDIINFLNSKCLELSKKILKTKQKQKKANTNWPKLTCKATYRFADLFWHL